MQSSKRILGLCLILSILILIFSTLWYEEQYLLMSFGIILLSFLPFLARFERKKYDSKEMVLISMLVAIGSIGRIPFQFIPGVQPTSFVIIVTGVVFGSEIGFFVGVTSAFVSNIFLGQGPWTIWQMFAWGLMGLSAGYFRSASKRQSRYRVAIFGVLWGFLFGWIMNAWFLIGFLNPVNLKAIFSVTLSSFPFDLLHAMGNLVFILLLFKRWEKILQRIYIKYIE
jgi:energy-coupling factor transport system substrate-specific component